MCSTRVDETATGTKRPPWLKKRLPPQESVRFVRDTLRDLGLATVCQSAHCPNIGECFAKGTATFMIMGRVCTRDCGFCAVRHGTPSPLDPGEPSRVAEAVRRMGLRHVVITSVTRDDLPDGGAAHFRAVVAAIRAVSEGTIEVLTPDFKGDHKAIETVVNARPTIYNHNLETVPRLYSIVRPDACYERSLDLLRCVKQIAPDMYTKSGLMLGLGETEGEVIRTMEALRSVQCDILTIGQYLRPSPKHLPVRRYVPPREFDAYQRRGGAMGFKAVSSGPFVRSSYNAAELFHLRTEVKDGND